MSWKNKEKAKEKFSESRTISTEHGLIIPEVDIVNYNPTGVLKIPVEVPTTLINGRQVPGWQTQRNQEGQLHSEPEPDSKPSLIHQNGLQEWYTQGKLDRGHDLPARIHPNGVHEHWKKGIFQGASIGGEVPSYLNSQSKKQSRSAPTSAASNRQQRRQEKRTRKQK